jgi:tetratricopeptide (TPR) repeat protein
MKVKRKIIKKKLKEPDEFISFTEKAFQFISHHLKQITAGGIIVLILLLSISFFQRSERKREEEAYRKFSLTVWIYQVVDSPHREGSPDEYKNILEKFEEILKKFPRTSSGKLSLLYKGNVHLHLGKFEEAKKLYQTFLQKAGKEKLYRLFAWEGLGYAFEGMKDYEKAVNAYQEVLKSGESSQWGGIYLSLGRCNEKLGKNNEALENYKAFLKVSPKSSMTNAILRKISYLEK